MVGEDLASPLPLVPTREAVLLVGTGGKTVYYSTGNQFERFRGFLELISRFEFEFCRRENYFF